MGWYDANPANLNPLPPEPAAKRYVEAMGGADAVLAMTAKAERDGELRWAATLLNHVVFADEHNKAARDLLAAIYTKLGFESEAGTWRNIYLTGAQELRDGVVKLPPASMSTDVLSATTTPMLLDFVAVRINPKKASERAFKINIELTDRREKHLISVENGVMIHEVGIADPSAGAAVRMKRPDLLMTLLAGMPVAARIESGDVVIEGDPTLYDALAGMIEPLTPNFPIVTP
jgi:alkyl sulfatase BDS1-like metallo-beta-lactamase superfamily hydrolase